MTIQYKFVELIPPDKEPGILYISLYFAVMSHLCPCGCGNLIVTPLAPHAWSLTFDGETISLNPSIGNWSLRCQSHYWITKNKIRWARTFDEKEIAAVQLKDEQTHKTSWLKRLTKKKKRKAKGQE